MIFSLDALVRPNIRKLAPYVSARNAFAGHARIFLDANENSIGSPIDGDLSRYPDPSQSEISRGLAEIYGLSPSEIFVSHGSDEAIDLLIRIFCEPRIDNILICPPTYGMYEVSAAINDVEVLRVNLTSEFELDVEAVKSAANENTKLIFLCSPNNPTGNSIGREAILEIAEAFSGIVVIDEAYIHFSNETSVACELDRSQNIVVLQTFSKAWGLAGLRVGLALGNPKIIELLNRVKLPYNVGRTEQKLILEALANRTMVDETAAKIVFERESLAEKLRRLSFIKRVYHSDANFLLVKATDPEKIYRSLLSEKIVIRNRDGDPLCDGCLRITVGTPNENNELLRALKKYEESLVY